MSQSNPEKVILYDNKEVNNDLQIIKKIQSNENTRSVAKNAQKLKNIILKSDLSKVFTLLTDELNPGNEYKSDSESRLEFLSFAT